MCCLSLNGIQNKYLPVVLLHRYHSQNIVTAWPLFPKTTSCMTILLWMTMLNTQQFFSTREDTRKFIVLVMVVRYLHGMLHCFYSTIKEVMPMVDAIEEMLGIAFIRSTIVGNAEKRGITNYL